MGSILCCPCKTVAKLFDPPKDHRHALFCLPLALFGLAVSVYLIIWGTFDSYSAITSSIWPDFSSVVLLLVALLTGILGVVGLVCIIFRLPTGLLCVLAAFKILTASILLTLVISWVIWIIDLIQGKKFAGSDIRFIVLFTIIKLIYILLSYWILCCFASLQKVISVDGTGWEGLNWKEIIGESAADNYP